MVKFDARTKVPIEKTKVEIERLVNLRAVCIWLYAYPAFFT